jgi:hypothetical protein
MGNTTSEYDNFTNQVQNTEGLSKKECESVYSAF